MLRISVTGPRGALAADPERALSALVKAAEQDGAEPEGWLAQAVAVPPLQTDPRYQVVADAVAEVMGLYQHTLVLLRGAIAEHLAHSPLLHKSRARSRLVTPEMIREVDRIVRQHHMGIAAALFGRTAVTQADWDTAIALGLIPHDADPAGISGSMYSFGTLLAHLDQASATTRYGTTLAEFRDYIARHPIPQTDLEQRAAEYAAHRGAQAISGLGGKVGHEISHLLIRTDKELDAQIRDAIGARFGDDEARQRMRTRATGAGLADGFYDEAFRGTVRHVASDIGHMSGDWARDMQRIAQTETHTAVQEGQTSSWAEEQTTLGTPPVRVYKTPRPGACKHCMALHLDGGAPRIYLLDDLTANGTNVGRKAQEWRAVVGSTHPYCFPAGAPVLTAQGYRPIELVTAGELVLTHRGRWRRVVQRWCRFERSALVEVNGIPSTQEHPWGSPGGWQRADQLQQGLELVQIPLPHANHRPALADEVRFLLQIGSLLLPRSVPVAPIGFKGEPAIDASQIDQEAADLVSRIRADSSGFQSIAEHLLEFRAQLSRLGGYSALDNFFGLGAAPACGVCGCGSGLPLVGSESHPLLPRSLSGAAQGDTLFPQSSGDGSAGSARLPRYGEHRLPGPVGGDQAANFLVREAFSAQFRPCAVVVRNVAGGCPVFNLSVHEDESYVVAGYAVHNCGCALHRVPHVVQLPESWRSGQAAPTVIGAGAV